MEYRITALAALLAFGSSSAVAQSQAAGNKQLERCNETLGTLAVVEDRNAQWYRTMQTYQVQSTVPLLRMLIQESNCFVVVERGAAMNVMRQERSLEQSGETRQGSNFGKGQMVAADYAMNPSITFSSRDSGGLGGAVAGSLKFREASTIPRPISAPGAASSAAGGSTPASRELGK